MRVTKIGHMEGNPTSEVWVGVRVPRIALRKRIKWALAHKKLPRTAQWLKSHPGVEPYAGIGTVSSTLKKMVDNGELYRIDNYGPLGGYGYKLNRMWRGRPCQVKGPRTMANSSGSSRGSGGFARSTD